LFNSKLNGRKLGFNTSKTKGRIIITQCNIFSHQISQICKTLFSNCFLQSPIWYTN